jgi:hypothetical protein
MRRFLAAIDRRAATSAWVSMTFKRRAAWSGLLSLEAGALFLGAAALIGETGAWILFASSWALVCFFFGAMAFRPETTPHAAVRFLLAIAIAFAIGFPFFIFVAKA